MGIKNFLKPSIFKLTIFIFVGIFYLYFIKEGVSAAGFNFAFFYNAYGFPFQYLITGDTSNLSGITNEMFLGNYFTKYGTALINPIALVLNIMLIYLLACIMSMLFAKMKVKSGNI